MPKKTKGGGGSGIVGTLVDSSRSMRQAQGLGPGHLKPFTATDHGAIGKYSTERFDEINKHLRDPSFVKSQRQRDELDADAAKLSSALEKLPVHPGTTYRGTAGGPFLDRYKVGDVVEEQGFLSTSKDEGVAGTFFKDKGAFFTIDGASGRNMTKYSKMEWQQEVVFDKGSRFKVTGRDERADGSHISLEELD